MFPVVPFSQIFHIYVLKNRPFSHTTGCVALPAPVSFWGNLTFSVLTKILIKQMSPGVLHGPMFVTCILPVPAGIPGLASCACCLKSWRRFHLQQLKWEYTNLLRNFWDMDPCGLLLQAILSPSRRQHVNAFHIPAHPLASISHTSHPLASLSLTCPPTS